MNITISAKDFKLTPAIKEYIDEKFSRLGKFHPQVQRIGVELDVDRNVTKGKKNRIEVWVYLPGRTVEAGLKAEHMREAVDLVYPKIERQLVKLNEERLARRRGR
ncbi:MAG: ribosome-associated translation inhibitor RaiA [Candidatus Kerfeldbacteria bacterium]|nr:ribosome-associated translation inhibitor RaiA [Candidatus Kerfeldbacteria bacterium]